MTIEEILDGCLDDIRARRASLADCLARYPEHAGELEPLLRAALAFEQSPEVVPSPEFKKALRERIMSYSKPEETSRVRDLLETSDAAQDSSDSVDGRADGDSSTPGLLISRRKHDA